jgi:hypothetical protein
MCLVRLPDRSAIGGPRTAETDRRYDEFARAARKLAIETPSNDVRSDSESRSDVLFI